MFIEGFVSRNPEVHAGVVCAPVRVSCLSSPASWIFLKFCSLHCFHRYCCRNCCFFVLVRGNVLSFTGTFRLTFSLPFAAHFSPFQTSLFKLIISCLKSMFLVLAEAVLVLSKSAKHLPSYCAKNQLQVHMVFTLNFTF